MSNQNVDLSRLMPEATQAEEYSTGSKEKAPLRQKPLSQTLGPLLAGKKPVEPVIDPANPNLIIGRDR
ncbi:MAG: hypothetical protein H7833_15800 [Magnetococcus sp. DMHC-1]|nr:hypothetical protein [Magnetococcales bacterium]